MKVNRGTKKNNEVDFKGDLEPDPTLYSPIMVDNSVKYIQ